MNLYQKEVREDGRKEKSTHPSVEGVDFDTFYYAGYWCDSKLSESSTSVGCDSPAGPDCDESH